MLSRVFFCIASRSGCLVGQSGTFSGGALADLIRKDEGVGWQRGSCLFFVERQEVNDVLIRSIRLDKDGGRRK